MNKIVRKALIAIVVAVIVVAMADFIIWETANPEPGTQPNIETGDPTDGRNRLIAGSGAICRKTSAFTR